MSLEALFALHEGLPRAGPGSDASTRRAIASLPERWDPTRILDVGCGPGAQTVVLAKAFQGHLVAVDIFASFLKQVTAKADAFGPSGQVTACLASMDALPFPPESFDLIWSEGAAYVIGIPKALELWRPLLSPKGFLAFTEACWFTDSPSPEAKAFWDRCYPGMTTVDGNRERAAYAGYELLASFPLPPEDWWETYYGPVRARITELRSIWRDKPDFMAVLDETQREMDLFSRHADTYGYAFFVLGKGLD